MTTELYISTHARRDLIDIYHYTLERHGDDQAERYLTELEALFHRLAETPALHRSVDEVHPGARRALFQRHAIYFRCQGDRCTILRVLHQRMDPGRHLFQE